MSWNIKEEKPSITVIEKPKLDIGIATPNRVFLKELSGGKTEIDTSRINDKNIGEKHPYNFMLYELAYKQVAIIFGGINKTVDFALGPRFYVESDNQAVVKKIEKFMEEKNFEVLLRIITRNLLIFGNAYLEIIGSRKSIEGLKVLDPKYMYVRRDKKGKILGYTQYRGNKQNPIHLKPNQVAHFAFNRIGDEAYGTSILRPLFGSSKIQLLAQFLELEAAMQTIIQRRANAPIHTKIGSDEYPATAEQVDGAAQDLVDLSNKNEIVTSHLIDMNVLDYRSNILDIKPYIEHYENSIIYGLEVPAVLLGRASVPEGLANVQMDAFNRRIKSLQSFIERTVEEKIFKRLHPNDHIEFSWGEATAELEDIEIMRLMNILKTPGLSTDTLADIENELRKKLGLEVIKNLKKQKEEQKRMDFENQMMLKKSMDKDTENDDKNDDKKSDKKAKV